MIKAYVEDIIRNLGKDVKFIQPIYEAITNSLEANATNIEIVLHPDNALFGEGKLDGFEIIDNGEEFTKKNIDSFCRLWSDNKLSIGCKGSGRFTWLAVFDKVKIESLIKDTGELVNIDFDKNFDVVSSINVSDTEVSENKTKIVFSNVSNRYFGYKGNDLRILADPHEISRKILQYLLVKLFLLKKRNKQFKITVRKEQDLAVIDYNSIPDLEKIEFSMNSKINDEQYPFEGYYIFNKDNSNNKELCLCANLRSTKTYYNDQTGIAGIIPGRDSVLMLVCSDYLDDKDNDSRNNLIDLVDLDEPNLMYPLTLKEIFYESKRQLELLIKNKYPMIEDDNIRAVEEAINDRPYLKKYINNNKDVLKSKEKLISTALKQFNDEKEKVKRNFDKLLEEKKIDSSVFGRTINDISEMAYYELGEYILYRETIINALEKSTKNIQTKEKFIHDVFMPMKTDSFHADKDKHYLTNLWLLDDKFMTYSYAASDKTVKQIIEKIKEKNEKKYKQSNRPDLSIFFNREDSIKDLLMVEFKGPNADLDEKNKSLTELPTDIRIIRDNIENLATVWGYIITSIDKDFAYSIEADGRFNNLFSTQGESKLYYHYNKTLDAHIYIIDLDIISSDAKARNATFLDILKKK